MGMTDDQTNSLVRVIMSVICCQSIGLTVHFICNSPDPQLFLSSQFLLVYPTATTIWFIAPGMLESRFLNGEGVVKVPVGLFM